MKSSNIGGQAVMEGVMMMNKDRYSVAVRRPDGEIEVKVEQHKPLTKHKGLLKVPILRGVFSFADSMIVGMSSLQRVFMYHGAEHKCINCIEHGLELNVENVLKSSREHKRCGTSFLMYVIVISIIFFMFIRVDSPVLKIVIRLLLIPVIAGVSYEFIRLAGKSDNKLVNLISKPGLMLQHLTTREPDAEMAEVAIAAVEAVFDWRAYLNENFGYTYPAKTEKKEHEEP